MQKLTCPRGGASHLTFSPDGDLLAVLGASPFGRAQVLCWTRSRDWEPTGIEHGGPLTGVAFHPSGRTLAYAGISNSLWAAQAAVPPPARSPPSVWRRRFAKEAPRPFTGVHFYPLTGLDEFVPNRAYVPRDENVAPRPDNWARGLAFTPDGRFMLAGHVQPFGVFGSRAGVFHWHLTENEGVWVLANPTASRGETECGAALVGGCLVLAGSWGVAACPVESAAGVFVPDVVGAKAVTVAAHSELVAAAERGGATVWSLRQPRAVAAIAAAHGSANALAFAPDGRTLAVGHSGGAVAFADAPTGTVQAERDFGVGRVTALAYAPDGLTLAVAGLKGVVVVDAE